MKLTKGKIVFLIIITFIVGFLYFLPNILVPYFYNQQFETSYGWRDMAYFSFEEMFSYGASIRDIVKGHFLGGDPFLWEYKDLPTTWDYYPLALIIGVIFKLLHFDNLGMLFVIGDFIFPPISFIIIFFLFFKITKNFLFSVLSSIIFLFFPDFFIFRNFLSIDFLTNISFLRINDLFVGAFNGDASRLFVPGITMIFLSSFLLLLYHSIAEVNVRKKWLILAGISYGLLFYIYFYYWVLATIALGALGLIYLFYAKSYFWRIVRIFCYGIIIAIPYWIRFFILTGNPIYKELQQRIGLLQGRVFVWPDSGYWILLFLFLGIFCWKRIENKNLFFYIAALLSAVLVVRNLQIVFGFNPQPDHWGSRINIHILALSIVVSAYWILKNILKKYKSSASILFFTILFLISIAINGQVANSAQDFKASGAFFLQRDIKDSFKWMNENIKIDSVVLTDSGIMRTALSFYTDVNVYLPHACLSLASNDEIMGRYEEVYAIYKIPYDMLVDLFKNNGNNYTLAERQNLDIGYPIFCGTYQIFTKDNIATTKTPEKIVDEFMNKYKLINPDIKSLNYRADYLYFGPYEQKIGDFNPGEGNGLNLIYKNNSVKIYKINHKI